MTGQINYSLTPREHTVARLLVKGLSNKRIAAALTISQWTAQFHVANVIKKLGAETRTDAAIRYVVADAFRQGIDASDEHPDCVACRTRRLQNLK